MAQSHSPSPPTSRLTDISLRTCDICIAALFLLVFLIPLFIAAVAIFLEDKQNPLFFQKRIGRGCKPFNIVKFRTMFVDKHRFDGTVDTSDAQGAARGRAQFQTTVPNDPRITRAGKFMRPIHFDELPQVWNVLCGDMSFVGVRPDVPVQETDYTAQEWALRHVARPGITGLAQVSTDVTSIAKRTAYDLEWVKQRSFGLYFTILGRTARKVLKRNSL